MFSDFFLYSLYNYVIVRKYMDIVDRKKGISGIEFFVLFGMIAIVAAFILLLSNPAKRIMEIRDMERLNEVNAIVDAILECQFDNSGKLPIELEEAPDDEYLMIGSSAGDCVNSCFARDVKGACFDIAKLSCGGAKTLVPSFIATIPIDPLGDIWNGEMTGYYIGKTALGQIKVGSCGSEIEPIETVKKYK